MEPLFHINIRVHNPTSITVAISDGDGDLVWEKNRTVSIFDPLIVDASKFRERLRILDLNGEEIRRFGEALFEILLGDELTQNKLNEFHWRAKREKGTMVMELTIHENQLPEIYSIPWEFLRVPAAVKSSISWLATDPNLVFARKLSHPLHFQPNMVVAGDSLRILLAASNPVDPDSPFLGQVKHQALYDHLLSLVDTYQSSGRPLVVRLIEQASRRVIDEVLSEFQPHIFHFIGHGRYEEETDIDFLLSHPEQTSIGSIALCKQGAEMVDWITAESFSDLFSRYLPEVIFLQAHESGAGNSALGMTSVASQLTRHNIPAVIAMQGKIFDPHATDFAKHVYNRLLENESIGRAVQDARRALSFDGFSKPDFALPVLFLQAADWAFFPDRVEKGVSEKDAQAFKKAREKGSHFIQQQQDALSTMIAVATGEKMTEDKLSAFVRKTGWYAGDIAKFLKKTRSLPAMSGSELIDFYHTGWPMGFEFGGRAFQLPQELISKPDADRSAIQGKFHEIFVAFDRETHFAKEKYAYPPEFKPWCEKLEDARKERAQGQSNRKLFNGRNLRLTDLKINEQADQRPTIETFHKPVYYFDGLGTNYAIDDPLISGRHATTLRNLVHGHGRLRKLSQEVMANPIGINVLIVTSDRELILQHRSLDVAVRPGEACSSTSGTVDERDADQMIDHPILYAVKREIEEELGLREEQMGQFIFLGVVREYLRGGLPDFHFAVKTQLSQNEVIDIAKNSGFPADEWEWRGLSEMGRFPNLEIPKTFEQIMSSYIETLLYLEQPPSLPLLTNLILLAEYQSRNPDF